MNHSYHYHATAAVTAEALVARGVDKAHAAITAILVARSNAMVDYWTPERATLDCPATQVDVDDAATVAMVTTGRCYPLMSMGHRWHFDAGHGWPQMATPEQVECIALGVYPKHSDMLWMEFGAHLHTAQDCDGPHAGYVGMPSNANRLLAIKRRTERGDSVGFWWRMKLSKAASWGHAADPDADKIENCRGGAVKSAVRLYELVSGKRCYERYEFCSGRQFLFLCEVGTPNMIESLCSVSLARNDHDLASRSDRVFQHVTGQELPPFVPFSGAELETWKGVVA
jgi:hypothetical protein